MKLIVGLGNPGTKYEKTRHNVGFITIDMLRKIYGNQRQQRSKEAFSGLIDSITIEEEKVLLLKPQTYMNDSGISVQQCTKYYSIKTPDIIVIHDELELKMRAAKAKFGGSNKGHNGLRSISSYIGNEYNRISVGISRPENKFDVSKYVLSKFTKDELDIIDFIANQISENIGLVIQNKIVEFNHIVQPQ